MDSKPCGHGYDEFINDCEFCLAYEHAIKSLDLHMAKMLHPAFGGYSNYLDNLPMTESATAQSILF